MILHNSICFVNPLLDSLLGNYGLLVDNLSSFVCYFVVVVNTLGVKPIILISVIGVSVPLVYYSKKILQKGAEIFVTGAVLAAGADAYGRVKGSIENAVSGDGGNNSTSGGQGNQTGGKANTGGSNAK